MPGLSLKLGYFLLVLSTALPAVSQNTTSQPRTGFPPCDALVAANLSADLLLPTSPAYQPILSTYFSTNARYQPWCFFQPQTTSDLSTAITALRAAGHGAGDWHIAVRSGGHGPPGSNNIANGVTIDLSHLNASWYDDSRGVASIQPGGRWRDVYANLFDTYNVTVTGGRDGDVGVGGFLLGGGISYYTGANGYGCDTVVGFEVVLANGSVVEASARENADLFKALKGGGANFGIVTRFDVEAMPAVDLAYGQRVVLGKYSDQVVENVVGFTEGASERPDDHLITLFTHTAGVEDVVILSIKVNTRGNLNTTAFEAVDAVPAVKTSWERMSLAAAAEGSQIQSGFKSSGATLTFLSSAPLLRHAAALFSGLTTTLTTRLGSAAFLSTMILQPLPQSYARNSERKGGNVMGVENIAGNAIMWTGGIGVNGTDADFAFAEAEFIAMTQELKDFAAGKDMLADFVYMNYAHPVQDVLRGYGEGNVRFLREVSKRVDEGGFWQERVPGGFKLARAG